MCAESKNWFRIAQKLEDVSLTGKLKQAPSGFVYLDVNNDLMKGLFAMMNEVGISKPPYFNKKFNNVGTHISVMQGDEAEELDVKEDMLKCGEELNSYPKHMKNRYDN